MKRAHMRDNFLRDANVSRHVTATGQVGRSMLFVSWVFFVTVLHLADQKQCNSVFLFCRSSQHEHGGDDVDHGNSCNINSNK